MERVTHNFHFFKVIRVHEERTEEGKLAERIYRTKITKLEGKTNHKEGTVRKLRFLLNKQVRDLKKIKVTWV